MTGRETRRRGRPRKTAAPAFQLLALAQLARRVSQERLAQQVSAEIARASPPPPPEPLSVTQPAVHRWLRSDYPRLARPTVSLKRPEDLGLRVACVLFRRPPARALALVQLLGREPSVSRVEHCRGDFNVAAELLVLDTRDIDDFVQRYEPDAIYELLERREQTRAVLRRLGRRLVAAPSD